MPTVLFIHSDVESFANPDQDLSPPDRQPKSTPVPSAASPTVLKTPSPQLSISSQNRQRQESPSDLIEFNEKVAACSVFSNETVTRGDLSKETATKGDLSKEKVTQDNLSNEKVAIKGDLSIEKVPQGDLSNETVTRSDLSNKFEVQVDLNSMPNKVNDKNVLRYDLKDENVALCDLSPQDLSVFASGGARQKTRSTRYSGDLNNEHLNNGNI